MREWNVNPVEGVLTGSRRFVGWWTRELLDVLPSTRARRTITSTPAIVVAIDKGVPELILERGSERRTLEADSTAPLEQRIRDALASSSASTLRIRVGDGQYFRRLTRLPARARRDYESILALELERDTPFRPGSVLSGHRPVGRPDRMGLQEVEQLVVKKSLLSRTVDAISEAGGQADGVDIWNDDRTSTLPVLLPLLPTGGTTDSGPGGNVLALLVTVLLATAGWHVVARQESALHALELQARELQPLLQATISRTESEMRLNEAAARLKAIGEARLPASLVLDRVTRALPDHTWIDSLKIDHDTIEISGLSQAASTLPPLLEAAACCTDVRLVGPVRYDSDHDRERFQIRARLLPANGQPVRRDRPESKEPLR